MLWRLARIALGLCLTIAGLGACNTAAPSTSKEAAGAAAAHVCPAMSGGGDDGGGLGGGGGISGVGGGGGLAFMAWRFLQAGDTAGFPGAVHILVDHQHVATACVYDYHQGQTAASPLVATLACSGGATTTFPYTSALRVVCAGSFGNSSLDLDVSDVSGELLGVMKRHGGQAADTSALLLGH